MPTLAEYEEAELMVAQYKVCGNRCLHGCGKVFPNKEMTRTDSHGQTYYWCSECYESVKDDKD